MPNLSGKKGVGVCPRFRANLFCCANCYFPCHWCAGGITLNIKWLEGVFYAVLNICTAMNMPHPGALQLLNDLFLSVHFEGCEKDGESCPKFKLQDFVSEVYANNLSQER